MKLSKYKKSIWVLLSLPVLLMMSGCKRYPAVQFSLSSKCNRGYAVRAHAVKTTDDAIMQSLFNMSSAEYFRSYQNLQWKHGKKIIIWCFELPPGADIGPFSLIYKDKSNTLVRSKNKNFKNAIIFLDSDQVQNNKTLIKNNLDYKVHINSNGLLVKKLTSRKNLTKYYPIEHKR